MSELQTVYAVMIENALGERRIAGMGRTLFSREEADEYAAWLKQRREEMREAARKNKEAMDNDTADGNADYYRFHNIQDGEELCKYVLVSREQTPWHPVEVVMDREKPSRWPEKVSL